MMLEHYAAMVGDYVLVVLLEMSEDETHCKKAVALTAQCRAAIDRNPEMVECHFPRHPRIVAEAIIDQVYQILEEREHHNARS